jgi:hypothetical protein
MEEVGFSRQAESLSDHLQRAMIVAMVPVRMMQMAVDQVVDMITMWYRLVAAGRSMPMTFLVATAIVVGRAPLGIGAGYLDHVLVIVVAMRMVQVAVMEIVDVVAMLDRGVAAAWSVAVRVILMDRVLGHASLLRQGIDAPHIF